MITKQFGNREEAESPKRYTHGSCQDPIVPDVEHFRSSTSTALSPTQRGLSRALAAGYVGVSATKFDEMVADGRMPKPKRIDSRKVWDVRALDRAFEELPSDGGCDQNPWDT